MRTRRPYAFRRTHLTGIDLAEQVERQGELRALRAALAPRLGPEGAQEETEAVLQQALDEVGEELLTEVTGDVDALLRTWGRLADEYRSAPDRAVMGRIALRLADLPGRLEERVHMVPNAGGLVAEAIPGGLVARLRYPVAAGRVQAGDLAALGQRLREALPAAIAREMVRVEGFDRLVHHAAWPLLRGLGALPQEEPAPLSLPPEPDGEGWTRLEPALLARRLSAGPLHFAEAWAPQPPPTEDHLPCGIEDIALDPTGTRAIWGRWEPWVHRLDAQETERRLGGIDGRAWWRHCLAAAISADGRRAATGGASITVWDLPSGRVLLDLAGAETQELHALAFSPCGRFLAAVGASARLTLFDAATGQERWSRELEDPAQSVAFSADGRNVLAGGWTGRLAVHGAEDGAPRAAFDDIGACINGVAVDPRGRFLVTAGGCGCDEADRLNPEEIGLRVWDAGTGSTRVDLEGHSQPVLRVAVVGDRVLSISDDGTLRAWSILDGRPLALVDLALVDDCPSALAASPDGTVLVGTRAGWVGRWRLGTG